MHVFGEGGVARCAAASGTELLGEVPLLVAIRAAADAGAPATLAGGTPGAAPYERIAARLAAKLGLAGGLQTEEAR